MFRLVVCCAAISLAAGQTDSELTAQISRLQAIQAHRTAERTARQDLPQPQIVTEDGNIDVRLPRQGTLRVTRQTQVDVGALADRVGLLETATVPNVAADARTVAYQAAYNASLTSMDRMNNRMDTMVSQMAGLNAGVAAQLSTLTGQVGTQMAGLESTMLATVNTALQSSIRAMDATADGLEEQGEAQQSAMVALNTSMQRRLEAAVNATRSLGSDTIYTHWGSKVCTAPSGFEVLKHYDGFTWGAHHDSNGGGIMLCLKNVAGDAGGFRTGGDSADIIMPVRADHRSYTGNAFPDRPIPCARCLYSKTCYLEVGIDGCQARGYERMYFGMLFGGHMGHRANNNRICVDQNRDGDWNDGGNWGAYMYPTIERGNIQQRQNQKTVKCQWCCKP